MNDLHNQINIATVIAPIAVSDNTAKVGTVIDNTGYRGLEYVIAIGVCADADATFTVLLEDSSDNSTFAAVADDFLIGTEAAASFTFADDNKNRRLGYVGGKRYTRMTITPANNASAATFGVVAIQGSPLHAPVANNA